MTGLQSNNITTKGTYSWLSVTQIFRKYDSSHFVKLSK